MYSISFFMSDQRTASLIQRYASYAEARAVCNHLNITQSDATLYVVVYPGY